MRELKPLERAIEFAGGQTALGKICGVHQTTVWGWLNERRGVVPARYVEIIAAALDNRVTAHDLRPDLYPA